MKRTAISIFLFLMAFIVPMLFFMLVDSMFRVTTYDYSTDEDAKKLTAPTRPEPTRAPYSEILMNARAQGLEEIKATRDCTELQAMFERNDSDASKNRKSDKFDLLRLNTDYMVAIYLQMQTIGCYSR